MQVGEFEITSALVCHPGPTVGYRIAAPGGVVTYLSDHEPALGDANLRRAPEWTSGQALAHGADLLIHDAQYTDEEYSQRIGWGHSSLTHALQFATMAGVRHLVPFHHDPAHDDRMVSRMMAAGLKQARPSFPVTAAKEGAVFALNSAGQGSRR
jgi:ribonuclease BN (tRNA processing enzyme)